ncbi:MAG: threonine--tRNA ligase [candidate division KSB1 bacterium]|nr:threonine--tRNA ligase [candidate division KSB1 bacterium]
MDRVKITFQDGSVKEFQKGITPLQILQQKINDAALSQKIVAARFNENLIDLSRPLHQDGSLSFVSYDTPEGMEVFWHSTAHIMAHAIKLLYPEAKFGFGPALEDRFFYDFDIDHSLVPEDLEKIEQKMKEIVAANHPFIREELSKEEAIKLFKERNEPYKVEHIQELSDSTSIYREGDFVDLCSGPHLPSTGMVKHFKLLAISGAYWKGDERNPMLQRIYGASFPTKEQLDAFLHKIEEAKRRDHRRLGRELDLFSINDECGAGLILWHPKGALIRKIIEDFWRNEHLKAGYELVFTPHIARLDLWGKSGHLDFFAENMFAPIEMENVKYQLKPMNCPFHLLIYKSQSRSYRDLPIRWAELGTVYRYERSGVLHGLMRVRGFTQDDAHIICRPDQLQDEIIRCLNFTVFILNTFGFTNFEIYLSTRPEKFVGEIKNWELATEALRMALEQKRLSYKIDPGEGVFYGPKIDIKIKDVLDRAWQCTTIQVDFNEPQRFDITYRGVDGQDHRPIMIHRALMGSLERFFGTLIEHYGGAFPVWLAPIQVMILPITDAHHEYARRVADALTQKSIRAKIDDRNEKVGFKIREAEVQKIPYMAIIGDKEKQSETVAVRKRKIGDLGPMKLAAFIDQVLKEIEEKTVQ